MDILIKREDEKKVHDILIGMGYTCDMYDISHQDVYFKDPIYNIDQLFQKWYNISYVKNCGTQ